MKDTLDSEEGGFTLIELALVLLVMAVLMAIAIPSFLSIRATAENRSAQAAAYNSMINGRQYYFSHDDTYPATTGLLLSVETTPVNGYTFTEYNSTGPNSVSVGATPDPVADYAVLAGDGVCWVLVDNHDAGVISVGTYPSAFPAGVAWAGVAGITKDCNAHGIWSGFNGGHTIPTSCITTGHPNTGDICNITPPNSPNNTSGSTSPKSTTPVPTALPGALTVLGNDGACSGHTNLEIDATGNVRVNVHGTLADFSSANCSIVATGSSDVVATKINVQDPTSGNAAKTTGTSQVIPMPTTAHISAYTGPTNIAKPAQVGTCTYVGQRWSGVWTCSPGYYSTTFITIVKSKSSSSYVTKLYFQSGVYYFNAGLHIGSGIKACSATGETCTSSAGVLFFIGGGSLKISGAGTVNLSPLSNGPIPGMLIFQAHTDCSSGIITGSGSLTTYQGEIYQPMDKCTSSGYGLTVEGAGTLSITTLITRSLDVTGSGTITVG